MLKTLVVKTIQRSKIRHWKIKYGQQATLIKNGVVKLCIGPVEVVTQFSEKQFVCGKQWKQLN
jgi:hypothetical protein